MEDALRRCVAESIGTFALIFAGAGSIMLGGSAGLVGIALATGLAIAVMVSAVGHISGGHFNPAITFGFLVWVVFATAADPRGTFKSIAGLAIGLTITMDVLVGGPLTGAAMNPARAFGPDLVQNVWENWWIWWVGPVAGGAAAALLYEWFYLRRRLAPEPVGPPETGVEEPGPGETAADV